MTSIWLLTLWIIFFDTTTVHLNIIRNLVATTKMSFNVINSLINALKPLLLQRHNLCTKTASEVTLTTLAYSLLMNLLVDHVVICRVYWSKMFDIDAMVIEESWLTLFIITFVLIHGCCSYKDKKGIISTSAENAASSCASFRQNCSQNSWNS